MYENQTTKRAQILEALRALMASISAADGYWTTVATARTYSAHKLALGETMPAIGIIPLADTKTGARICAEDEWRLSVEVVGALRVQTVDDTWKETTERFAGDVQQILNQNRQLGGLCVYAETEAVEIADADTGGGQAQLSGFAVTVNVVYRVSVVDVSA